MRPSSTATVEHGATGGAPKHAKRRGHARHALELVVSLGVLLAVVFAVPSLGSVRRELEAIDPWWVAAGVALEIGSCASFVVVFRAFFDQLPPGLARRIAWIEMGSGALLPGGGVTSYMLGGLLLNQAGMDRRGIVVRSGGVFWLTSAVNALALALGAGLLLSRIGGGPHDLARAVLPLIIAAPLTLLVAASPKLVGHRRQHATAWRWWSALTDGVADAWRAARQPTWRLAGAVGYLALDMAVLLCLLRGVGYDASGGTLILGYLIGYCATLIPVPAGIGVLEGGLVGTLVLYGTPPAQTAGAVLIYHTIAFWIPSLGGLGAYAALRAQSRTNKEKQPCVPPTTSNRSGAPQSPSNQPRSRSCSVTTAWRCENRPKTIDRTSRQPALASRPSHDPNNDTNSGYHRQTGEAR
jgi:uncharacterized membrane protein YbhN (UPF0104 family)